MVKYNLIIPVAFKDYPFLKKTIRYIEQNLSPNKIFILTNKEMSCCIPLDVCNNKRCMILDEDWIVPGLDYQTVKTMLECYFKVPVNVGWYYQQFLKMGFALSKECDTEYYLSWDADTLPIRQILFFNAEGHPYFTMKSEHHSSYFETIERLLGLVTFDKGSYIAEHMMFKKEIVRELIGRIEKSSVEGDSWIEKIIHAVSPDEPLGFSEFETYGNYSMYYHPDLYEQRQLSGFRYGGFISGRYIHDKILKTLSFDLSTVSFETYHVPPFPWSLFSWLYDFYLKKILYKKYRIRQRMKWIMEWKLRKTD